MLASALVFAWNLAASGLRVRRAPVLGPLGAVLGFSGFQFAHGLVNYFCRNADNLLVGLSFGGAPLGFYSKAYQLSTYPITMFTSVVASVLHPYLSEHQDEPDAIYGRFVTLEHAVFAVGIPVSACCVASSEELVTVLFGDAWRESAPLLRALTVSVMFQMAVSLTGSVFQSLGDTRDMFRSAVVNTALTIVAVGVGVASGDLLVLAAIVSLAFCLNPVATFYYLVVRAFGAPVRQFVREFAPQLAVAAVMLVVGAVVCLACERVLPQTSPLVLLVAKTACCGALYSVLLHLSGQWRYVAMLVSRKS